MGDKNNLRNHYAAREYWIIARIEIPVITLKCNVFLRFCNSEVEITCAAIPEDNKNIFFEFSEYILNSIDLKALIIYSSHNHFEHLLILASKPRSIPENFEKSKNNLINEGSDLKNEGSNVNKKFKLLTLIVY